jgi:hypothetical protein
VTAQYFPRLVVLLALACAAAARADEGSPAGSAPAANPVAPGDVKQPAAPAADAAMPPPAGTPGTPGTQRRRQPVARKPGQAIDANVRKLTQALDLNSEQQAKLREILLDQYRQVAKLRSQSPEPGSDRVAMNLALLDRTKARIRSILTDEQKKKYIVDVPREQTAPAQADLQHWMDVQEAQRRAGDGDGK